MDITDDGVIVGTLGTGGPTGIHGFWISQGNWQILDDPDYPPSSTGLNALRGGVYVGQAFDNNGTGHAIQLVGKFILLELRCAQRCRIVGGAKISGGGNPAFIAQCQ